VKATTWNLAWLLGCVIALVFVGIFLFIEHHEALGVNADITPVEADVLDELVVSGRNARILVVEDAPRQVICYLWINANAMSCVPTKDTSYGKAIDK
jgi:hypothetical protein